MATPSRTVIRTRVGRECRKALQRPGAPPVKMSDVVGRGGLGYGPSALGNKIEEIADAVASDPQVIPAGAPISVPIDAARTLVAKTVSELADYITKEIIYDLLKAGYTVDP